MLKVTRPLSVVALLSVLCLACSQPQTPETAVRQTLDRLATAAEARDLGDFRQGISAQYRDADGRDAGEITNLVRGYFLMNQSIHLLTRIDQVEFPSTAEARVKVTVGMLGKEAAASDAWSLAAQIHDFDVTLMNEEGDWRVTFAQWHRPN